MYDKKQLFLLGNVVGTPAAIAAFAKTAQSPLAFVDRHATGDYGEMTRDDKNANTAAIKDGGRIMSAYTLYDGTKVWIITNAWETMTRGMQRPSCSRMSIEPFLDTSSHLCQSPGRVALSGLCLGTGLFANIKSV